MRRIWRRKWLIAAVTLTVFLSVGAVAWAAAGGDGQAPGSAGDGQSPADDAIVALAGSQGQALTIAAGQGPLKRELLKEKREQRIKRNEALMKLVRDKMTPQDQAAYDQLVQKAKDQRAVLKQAREDLAKTVKDLRELTKKYIDVGAEAAGAAPAATTAQ